jgi:hypothetical protein
MVRPADTGGGDEVSEYDDSPDFARPDQPRLGSVLFEPQMRSVLVVVVKIGPDHASKLPLIDRDHMVQAIPS